MTQGKISTRALIEKHFSRQLWAVLRAEFTDCKNITQAAELLNKLTSGNISVKPNTIFRMIAKGIEEGQVKESDFYYVWGIPEKKGKQGVTSIREKLEEYTGQNFWAWLRKDFTKCKSKEDVCEKISHETNEKISISPVTLVNTIEKGTQQGEVKPEDFFAKWGEKKKRKQKEESPVAVEAKQYPINGVCKNCGHEEIVGVSKPDLFVADGKVRALINIVAHKCPKCKYWATMLYTGKIEKHTIKEEYLTWMGSNPHKFSIAERQEQQKKEGVRYG
jgi:hypothetical protein